MRGIQRGLEPVNEKEYLTDAFTREALAFLDRHKDKPFFLYLPFNAVHTPLQAPAKYMERVSGVGHPRRKIYAAMLTALDDGVGAILAKLRESKLEENTLIFFLSDNGGAPQPYNATDNRPLSGKKGELLEGGIHVPFLVQWKGTLPASTVYEKPVISLDIFATTMAVAGGELAKDRVYDGVNLVPFLGGKNSGEPHKSLFWRYGEYLAMREGQWKLHKSGKYPAQLYDLTADIGETMDLAAKQSDRVKKMEADLAKWNGELKEPMWGPMGPHERNLDWLFEILSDPRLRGDALRDPGESKP